MIQFISPKIIGSNVCQLQTSLTLHFLVKIVLFAISVKIHFYVNVSGVFGVFTILSYTYI